MSCIRQEKKIKRKLGMRSPDPQTLDTSVTPALRGAVAREELIPKDSDTDCPGPFNRLPSKRRLF